MDYKRNINRVFWIYFSLFLILCCWITKFVFFDSKAVVASPYNPRVRLADSRIVRGEILDSDGNILAETKLGEYNTRSYPYGGNFAHTVGFSGYNSQGAEAVYSVELLKASNEISQRFNDITKAGGVHGNRIVLTVDSKLQLKACELMDGRKGAIIAIEPATGKILSCVSNPSFDPNRVAIEWDELKSDTENNPLINRATQGLYPPGSIFKIVTLTAALRYMPDYKDFTYTCTGAEDFGGKTIRCYNGKAHGEVGYKEAFAKSCNTYFAVLGERIGAEKLAAAAEGLLFNKSYQFPLEYVKSSFTLNGESDLNEIVETSIGQGRTLVTPLHMAFLACAVANDGYLMRPYIVDRIEAYDGKPVKKYLPEISTTMLSSEECIVLSEVMKAVAIEGTASQLSKNLNIAGKTGTAENSSGADHGWFVAYAPADNPKIAVAVLLENSGGSSTAIPVAEALIAFALSE